MTSDPESTARAVGLRLLESAPKTRSELARAMAKKDVPEDVADEVLDRFAAAGLIDDSAFAKAWVDSRHRGRGLARRALAQELRRKGVDDEIASVALLAVSSENEEVAAEALVRRRLRSMSGLARDVQTRRLVAMLGRKGFNGGLSYSVVSRVLNES